MPSLINYVDKDEYLFLRLNVFCTRFNEKLQHLTGMDEYITANFKEENLFNLALIKIIPIITINV